MKKYWQPPTVVFSKLCTIFMKTLLPSAYEAIEMEMIHQEKIYFKGELLA